MQNKALVVMDLQNDITPNYREIIDRVNAAIDWAAAEGIPIVYIKHNFPLPIPRTFKRGTYGEEFVPELKVVSSNVFRKTRSNALTSGAFSAFIRENAITEFFVVGADAAACVKATCRAMAKKGCQVHVLSDCVTGHDKEKLPKILRYYAEQGCLVERLEDLLAAE